MSSGLQPFLWVTSLLAIRRCCKSPRSNDDHRVCPIRPRSADMSRRRDRARAQRARVSQVRWGQEVGICLPPVTDGVIVQVGRALHVLHLFLLLLGCCHLRCVLLPPLRAPVLEPHLKHRTRLAAVSAGLAIQEPKPSHSFALSFVIKMPRVQLVD